MLGHCLFDLGFCTATVQPPKPPGAPADAELPQKHTERAVYPTIASAAAVGWHALNARVPRAYYALQLLLTSGKPTSASVHDGEFSEELLEVRARLSRSPDGKADACSSNAALARAKELVSDAFVAEVAAGHRVELAPICAVVGGVIASEVIKIISGNEKPINNAFFFDAKTSDGVTVRLGPSFECPWGADNGQFRRSTPANVPTTSGAK